VARTVIEGGAQIKGGRLGRRRPSAWGFCATEMLWRLPVLGPVSPHVLVLRRSRRFNPDVEGRFVLSKLLLMPRVWRLSRTGTIEPNATTTNQRAAPIHQHRFPHRRTLSTESAPWVQPITTTPAPPVIIVDDVPGEDDPATICYVSTSCPAETYPEYRVRFSIDEAALGAWCLVWIVDNTFDNCLNVVW